MNSKTEPKAKKETQKKKRLVHILIEIILSATALWLLFIFVGRTLSKIALEQIAELTNTQITADSINFKPDGSVVIEELLIKPESQNKYNDMILKAQMVRAHFNLSSVLLFRPRLKRLIVSDFVFNILYDTNTKQCNLSGLKIGTAKAGTGKMPNIVLNRGTFLYNKISEKHKEIIAEIDFDSKLAPVPDNDKNGDATGDEKGICSFEIQTGSWGRFGKSDLSGIWQPGKVKIHGQIQPNSKKVNEDFLTARDLNVNLSYEADKDYSLELDIKDMISKEKAVDEHFTTLRSFFPEKLSAFEVLQKVFDRFRPRGQIDLYIVFSGNLAKLNESKLEGKVNCKNVFILDSDFEYPIEKLRGQIDITERSAVLNNLEGYHKDVQLFFNGWTKSTDGNQEFNFQITSDNMLLDNDLYSALKIQQKRVWDDFSPAGIVSINQNIKKQSGIKSSVLAITLLNSQARWINFPYPLKNLSGKLVFDSNEITFSEVVSQSDKERITVNGKVSSYDSDNPLYHIEIEADKTEPSFIRDEEYTVHLSKMLPPYLMELISELEVRGDVNFKAQLDSQQVKESLDYDIVIDCLGNRIDYSKLPYPFRDVRGRLKIKNDSIKLENFKGIVADNIQITPESSIVKVESEIKIANNSFTDAFVRIEANDISLDERLGVALPRSIGNIYFATSPTGRADLDFKNIKIFTGADGTKYIDLSGLIKFKGCNLNISPTITETNGTLKIAGLYKSGQGFCDGEAELNNFSVRIKDKLLTDLKVDMVYDSNLSEWRSRLLTASCYKGTVGGKFSLAEPNASRVSYILDVGFYDIDLKQFLSDPYHYEHPPEFISAKTPRTKSRNDYSRGNMDGSLSIEGLIGGQNERIGRCRLEITDMEAGKLSPIAKLLYILKLTEPKDFAFEQMLVDSYLKNNNLYLQKVDISGKAIAFNGFGHLDLENLYIDSILTGRGQRLSGARPGVLQSLTEGLGQGIIQMSVTGNVYEPQVITETLPMIKGAFYLLGTPEAKKR